MFIFLNAKYVFFYFIIKMQKAKPACKPFYTIFIKVSP